MSARLCVVPSAAIAAIALSLTPRFARADETPGPAPAASPEPGDAVTVTVTAHAAASKRKRTISFSVSRTNPGAAMSGPRFFVDWLLASGGVALTGLVTAPFLFGYGSCPMTTATFPRLPGCTQGDALVVTGTTLFLGGSPFVAAGLTTLLGNSYSGRGSFWWSLLGASLGTAAGATVLFAGSHANSDTAVGVGIFGLFVLPGFGAALAYEVSSASTLPPAPPPAQSYGRLRRAPARVFLPAVSVVPLLAPREGSTQPRADGVGLTVGGAF